MQRLQGNRAGFLTNRKKELDEIHAAFATDDFTSDKALTGEFLLGYHCQRMELRKKAEQEPAENNNKEN
jgi:CRISPR-associated protein Csd1